MQCKIRQKQDMMVFDYTKQNAWLESKLRAHKGCYSFCKGVTSALRSGKCSSCVAKEGKCTEACHVNASQ